MAQKVTVSRRTLLQGTAAAAAVSALPHAAATAEAAEDTAHIRDFAMIEKFYAEFPKRMARVRACGFKPPVDAHGKDHLHAPLPSGCDEGLCPRQGLH